MRAPTIAVCLGMIALLGGVLAGVVPHRRIHHVQTFDKTDLVFWLDFENTSWEDSHGSIDFSTGGGTPSTRTGIVGNGIDLVASSSEYIQRAAGADVNIDPSYNSGDTTFCFWVNMDSLNGSGFNNFTIKGNSTNTYAMQVDYKSSTTQPRAIFNDGSWTGVIVQPTQTLNTGTDYFIVAWFDSSVAGGTTYIQINNGTPASGVNGSITEGNSGQGPIQIGGSSSLGRYVDGMMDSYAMFRRVLTADERTWLYNSGNGRAYSGL